MLNGCSTEGFRTVKRSFTTASWWMYVIRHLPRCVECTIPSMNLTVKYGLWVIMLCQSRFISCNKCPSLLWDVDNGGGGCACVEAGAIGTSLHLLLDRAVNLKQSKK